MSLCGRRSIFAGAAFLLATGAALGACAEGRGGVYELFGVVGAARAGLQITLRDDETVEAAHYFLVNDLVDHPLRGHFDGAQLVLEGADGRMFTLHATDDLPPARDGLEPPTFFTASSFVGRATKGDETATVKFDLDWYKMDAGRLYDAPDLTDAAYEARVRQFLQAVMSGDRNAAARFVSFPLAVNGHGRRMIRDKQSFLARWPSIFTPAVMTKIREAVPHEMFVHEGLAMVSNGELWFDGAGNLTAINQD
jgi:hypothetical protein